MKKFNDQRDWFFEARFGMFVHWGIYTINRYHEQEQFRLKLSRAEYTPLMHSFNPQQFDPDTWLDYMENIGMKYLVFTAKHIDGFCMWDTRYSDYNVMHTPYGKDVLEMVAEACQRRNVPLCIYYSIPDMNHSCYPNNGRSYELPEPEVHDTPDLEKYLDYVKKQVEELCTNYGTIHGFWWDGNVLEHQDTSINKIVRNLQPAAIINNRGFDEGDFCTPERDWDKSIDQLQHFDEPLEACESIGYQSWGYRHNEDYYTKLHLTQCIDKVFAKGGNYLLNVGPDETGRIPTESSNILQGIGGWMDKVSESFFAAKPSLLQFENRDVLITQNENILYVHLYKPLSNAGISLKPLNIMPRKATILNNGEQVKTVIDRPPRSHTDGEKYLRLQQIPLNEISNEVIIIKLEFDALPKQLLPASD